MIHPFGPDLIVSLIPLEALIVPIAMGRVIQTTPNQAWEVPADINGPILRLSDNILAGNAGGELGSSGNLACP